MFRRNRKSAEYACAPRVERRKKRKENDGRRNRKKKSAPVSVFGRPRADRGVSLGALNHSTTVWPCSASCPSNSSGRMMSLERQTINLRIRVPHLQRGPDLGCLYLCRARPMIKAALHGVNWALPTLPREVGAGLSVE